MSDENVKVRAVRVPAEVLVVALANGKKDNKTYADVAKSLGLTTSNLKSRVEKLRKMNVNIEPLGDGLPSVRTGRRVDAAKLNSLYAKTVSDAVGN